MAKNDVRNTRRLRKKDEDDVVCLLFKIFESHFLPEILTRKIKWLEKHRASHLQICTNLIIFVIIQI